MIRRTSWQPCSPTPLPRSKPIAFDSSPMSQQLQQFLQQFINGLSIGAIYALIAVGYTMVYGVLQLINFAHGDVFMVGAMVALYAATGRVPPSMPWWLHGLIVGGLTAWFLIAWLVGGRSPKRCLRTILPLAAMYLLSVPLLWCT